MLKINDIDLYGDSPDEMVSQFLSRYAHPNLFLPWVNPNRHGTKFTFRTGTWPLHEFRLNRLYWPNSASRWAYGHYLAASEAMEEIREAAYTDNGEYRPVTLKMGDGREKVEAEMYVLPPVPLSYVRDADKQTAQSLYMITLVDNRWFWWHGTSGMIGSHGAWDSLYSAMFAALTSKNSRTAFLRDTIDPKYLEASRMFSEWDVPVPLLMDAVAFNVGHRIACDYDGLTMRAEAADTALDRLNQDFVAHPKRVILAGDRFSPEEGPKSSPIKFERGPDELHNNINGVSIHFRGCNDFWYGSYSGGGASEGKDVEHFVDTVLPCKHDWADDEEGIPSNKDVMDDLTEKFAEDFLAWQSIRFHMVLQGICAVTPTGLIDLVIFDYGPGIGPGSCKTTIRSGPYNGHPRYLGHEDNESDCVQPFREPDFLLPAVTTTLITGRSEGAGTDGEGEVSIGGHTRKVYNQFLTQVEAGKRVWLTKSDCLLYIVSADC